MPKDSGRRYKAQRLALTEGDMFVRKTRQFEPSSSNSFRVIEKNR